MLSRWSGDVIWRTGMKNFNAVSHNRVRLYFWIQHGRGEVTARRVYLNVHSVSNRKCGRHGMICWVLAMEILQGVWKQHLRPRAIVGYGVNFFLPSPPNYVTRSPGTSPHNLQLPLLSGLEVFRPPISPFLERYCVSQAVKRDICHPSMLKKYPTVQWQNIQAPKFDSLLGRPVPIFLSFPESP